MSERNFAKHAPEVQAEIRQRLATVRARVVLSFDPAQRGALAHAELQLHRLRTRPTHTSRAKGGPR